MGWQREYPSGQNHRRLNVLAVSHWRTMQDIGSLGHSRSAERGRMHRRLEVLTGSAGQCQQPPAIEATVEVDEQPGGAQCISSS